MKILTAEQMRRIDQECIRGGTPAAVLMENAGRAVAEETVKLLGKPEKHRVVVLAGPGNNGGDGLVAARYLHEAGAAVSVYLCTPRPDDDPNLALVRERGIPVVAAADDAGGAGLDDLLAGATCVLDGLLGTGRLRPLEGPLARALNKVRDAREKKPGLRIVAIDLPSGLDADNGRVDTACLAADNTITLAFPKLGLFSFPGAAYAGGLTVVDIGIPAALAEGVLTELLTSQWARSVLPPRPPDANKGTFGKVLVMAGSPCYVGAAYLACSGALRVGAGLVTLATTPRLQAMLAAKLTEVTYLPLPETGDGEVSPEAGRIVGEEGGGYGVRLVGCGVGQSAETADFVRQVLFSNFKGSRVVDADGLNILAGTKNWWQKLAGDAILTPHP
ncbi:MAG: NAD(P)H-hydrate epimerase, partial [Chloroflexota bacterium]